jgi:hypothetical protein
MAKFLRRPSSYGGQGNHGEERKITGDEDSITEKKMYKYFFAR